MDVTTLLIGCAVVSGMVGAGAAAVKAGTWLWRGLRKLVRLADDLTGEPPRQGMPEGRPGVLDRLAAMDARWEAQLVLFEELRTRLASVEAQLKPNGGGSLRDAVDQLKQAEQVSAA